MNQMQPVAPFRAPPASVVLDRSGRALPIGTERYVVPGAGSVAVQVSAGDMVRVSDIEGCQPCELVFAGADGRVDPLGLGVPSMTRAEGLLALLAETGESARRTRSALARRSIDLASAHGLRVFGEASPAGASAHFTIARDGLLIVAAPGGVMDAGRQDTATEIELLITRRVQPGAAEAVRLPEPLADPLADFRIKAATATAYRVKAGDYIQVIDVSGRQCTDFQCFSARKLDRGLALPLDATVTRTLLGRLYPTPGLPSKGFAHDFEPLVELVRDTSGGTMLSRPPAMRVTTTTWAIPAMSIARRTSTGHWPSMACRRAGAGRRSIISTTPMSTATISSISTSRGRDRAIMC